MRGGSFITLLTLLACACGGVRQFAARPIVWQDNDRRPYSPAPPESFTPYFWNAIDNMIFRPASEVWTFSPDREAINVNALDEVPDSSWFVNRISRRPMSPAEIARGACPSIQLDIPAPWRIFSGKPDGASPGFLFRDATGQRWVLKVDRVQQPEQSTAADATVGALFHAAGFYVPCNRVVGFTEDMLMLENDAVVTRSESQDRRMTYDDVRAVIGVARHWRDGRYRAVVSRFIDGRPIGPWSYMGVRDADPNDVVPHELRRELRGMFVLNAWVNHWDARDTNTLASWIDRGSRGGYVRHYLIDFGEALGLVEGGALRARRFGHSQWLDVQHIVEDAFGFGLVRRPWDSMELGPSGRVLGYYEVEGFDPEQWRPDYWNGAFERMTEHDAAWMARIIARFDRSDLQALAAVGNYTDPRVERDLVRILAGRRRLILSRYLTRLSPLADPVMRENDLACVTDLAVSSRLRWAQDRVYQARAHGDRTTIGRLPIRREGANVCVALPRAMRGGYLVVDLASRTRGGERNFPARLHFVVTAPGRFRVVGLERPASHAPPG